jgi:glycosyltransferase involved in cell wall biosynthesis
MEEPMRRICLCMIVKNEAQTIRRCIDSVRHVGIDRWCIVDTGSTDGTPARIEELLGNGEIEGELHQRPWVNFGVNRTELLRLAPADHDLLVLDADMTVQAIAAPHFAEDVDALEVSIYGDHDNTGPVSYGLPLLLRAGRAWEYRGATHEYLCLADGTLPVLGRADGFAVEHHGDGGARKDKLKRDRKLLRDSIDRGEEVQRSTFYLAQTEELLGRAGKARRLYERRAALGGWAEEVFVALLRAGRLARDDGDWERALGLFWRAYDVRPTRAESLYEISGEARNREEFALAHAAATLAVRLPRPDDRLFVTDWVYEYGAMFEFSVTSQRAGDYAAAANAVDRLLAVDGLPDAYREAALRNRAEYGPPPAA